MILNQSSRRHLRKGNIIALVALSLPFLIGLAAFALDGGLLMDDHRIVQAAADAAALAGATGLAKGDNNTHAEKSGKTTALAILSNYYGISSLNDGTTNVVTVNASGTFQGGANQGSSIPAGEVEAIVTYNRPRAFSRIWSSASIAVTARAVANKPSTGTGLLVLDPSASNALTTTNTANITVTGGNIIVDSSDSKGATSTNTGIVSTDKSLILSGSPGYNPTTKFSAGTILSGQTATPDPLASLSAPPQPGSSYSNVNISNMPSSPTTYGAPGPLANQFTLNPGVYNNGIHISDNNSSHTYIFAPGTYWFSGGGLSLSSNANITGSGVMLYFDNGGAMSITAGGSVTLSPQTTGTYAGITVFQNKTNTSQDSVTCNGSFNMTGTFYAAGAKLTLTGSGGNYALGSEYIVKQLVCTGSGNFNITTSSSSGSGIIGLVE